MNRSTTEAGAAGSAGADEAAPRTALMVVGGGEAAARCRGALLTAGRPVTAVRAADDAARRAAAAPDPQVIVLELQSAGYDGLAALAALRAAAPRALVVVLAMPGALNRARAAMEMGAFDYLVHPADDALTAAVTAGAEEAAARPTDAARESRLIAAAPCLEGSSAAAADFRARATRLARASAPILLTGERGVGKSLAAAGLHALSARPGRPMHTLRCDRRAIEALAADLDAALRRWASDDEPGASLLVQTVCTLPTGLQSRALRLLDAAERAGAAADGAPRLRLIFSARDDLEQRVADGQFRENLHQRLAIAELELPPLRERGEDASELAERRLARIAPGFRGLHPETRRALNDHPWPRNIAQLGITVDALAARLEDGIAVPAGLDEGFLSTRRAPRARRASDPPAPPRGAGASPAPAVPATGLAARVAPLVGLSLEQVETALVEATLASCGGSVAEASRILGISQATLYRRRSAALADEARTSRPETRGPERRVQTGASGTSGAPDR